MKTKILHLDSYDDLHSIKDKISWGTGGENSVFALVRTAEDDVSACGSPHSIVKVVPAVGGGK